MSHKKKYEGIISDINDDAFPVMCHEKAQCGGICHWLPSQCEGQQSCEGLENISLH